MIVDSSALVAIVEGETDADDFARRIRHGKIPAPVFVEAAIVLDNRLTTTRDRLGELLDYASVSVIDFTPEMAAAARTAYRRFGRGSGHPAKLNFGDCLAYAAATVLDEPLLFKGEDFTHTDVRDARAEAAR